MGQLVIILTLNLTASTGADAEQARSSIGRFIHVTYFTSYFRFNLTSLIELAALASFCWK